MVILRQQPVLNVHACTLVVVPSRGVRYEYVCNGLSSNYIRRLQINGQKRSVQKLHLAVCLILYTKMIQLHLSSVNVT